MVIAAVVAAAALVVLCVLFLSFFCADLEAVLWILLVFFMLYAIFYGKLGTADWPFQRSTKARKRLQSQSI